MKDRHLLEGVAQCKAQALSLAAAIPGIKNTSKTQELVIGGLQILLEKK